MSYLADTVHTMRPERLLERILRGEVANVDFNDLVRLVEALGFRQVGGRGSHRVFARTDVQELVNLQKDQGEAKRYQVRQVTTLVRKYDLHLEDPE
ncbi:MAG: type II toxin-antitoxin system HicA family toxin [Actinomycetota bacterium]|nr:type II toxin-antitoxin system HicA family toxin [Actinomycetota bacterium]